MVDGLIPRRYAKALYKFALEKGTVQKVYDCMKVVIESFQSNPDLQKVLTNPHVSADDKKKLLETAAGAAADDVYRRFVWLVLEHDREDFFYLIALSYRDIYRTANKISQVKITTAAQMGEAELERLRAVVSNAFPDRKLEFSYGVDKNLIGGFVIDVDSTRMDASLSNELEQIRQNIIRSK